MDSEKCSSVKKKSKCRNVYIPPPARKLSEEAKPNTFERVTSSRSNTYDGSKACNDSSKLFLNDNERVYSVEWTKHRQRTKKKQIKPKTKPSVDKSNSSVDNIDELSSKISPENTDITNNTTDISNRTDNTTDISKITHNTNDISKITHNTNDISIITDNTNDISIITDNTTDVSKVTDHTNSISQITDDNTNNISKITDNTTDISQITDNTTDISQITDNTTDISQITDNTTDISQITYNTTDISQITDNTPDISQITDNTIDISSISDNIIENVQNGEVSAKNIDQKLFSNNCNTILIDNTIEHVEKLNLDDEKFGSEIEETSQIMTVTFNNSKVDNENLTSDSQDWESLYDDSDHNKFKEILDEGKKKKIKPEEKYDKYEIENRGSILEIYGFSKDLKTNDLVTVLSAYTTRGLKLSWVDDTHALAIFPSPSLADEVLACELPLIKTRPLVQATQASQEKARTLILPSTLRPKTCSAMARRLVSGALGLKVSITPEAREAEREILRKAREEKKLAAKQRDAAWEGVFDVPKNNS